MPQPSHGDDTAIMTADGLHIPPYRPDDPDVVAELVARFGAELFTIQPTLTGMPVLWVPRERLIEVLTCLRQTDRPYVMLYDLHAMDERLRTHRQGLPPADRSEERRVGKECRSRGAQ